MKFFDNDKDLKEEFEKRTLEKYGFQISLTMCINNFYHYRGKLEGIKTRIKNGCISLGDFDKEVFRKFKSGGIKPKLCNVSIEEWLDAFDAIWIAGSEDVWTYDIKDYLDAYCYWVTDEGRIIPCDFMNHYQTLYKYINFIEPGYSENNFSELFLHDSMKVGEKIIKEKGYCWVRFPSRMGFTELSVRTSNNITDKCLKSLKILLKNEAPKYDEWTKSYSLDKENGFYKLFNLNALIKELNNS